MDDFLKSVEDNFQKQVYIAGYRILFLAENYIIDEGSYLGEDSYYTDSDPVFQFFNESFINGEVAGEEQALLFNYETLSERIQNKADKVNLEITLS